MAFEFGHLDDDTGQHRMQAFLQPEQVLAVGGEQAQVVVGREVQAASQARQHLAQTQDVADRVVMAQALLPRDIARYERGPRQGGLRGL
jgi:hypothetical protein